MDKMISVIVPVYNTEKYLKKCVDSIINQTYTNLEIILVNDGSKDNSGTICDEYAKKDPRIKVIHKENGGLSDARNCALNVLSGEYVCFVDSDDFIPENTCEIMIKNIGDADILQGSMYSVTRLRTIKRSSIENKVVIKGLYEILNSYYYNKKQITSMACGKLYKAHLFNDIRFPVARIYEDAAVMYKLLEKCKEICIIPDFVYYWRENENSITHTKNKKYYLDKLLFAREQAEYFVNKNSSLSDYLYKYLLDMSINMYVELSVINNSELKDIVVNMLKEYMKENTVYLEKEKLELIQEIIGQKKQEKIKKCVSKFRIKMYKTNVKTVLKRILGFLIRNKDF